MQSYFIWKKKNSRDMGLWVNSLPPETRAQERVTQVKVPGRSGHLTLREGNNVYETVSKYCIVIARRDANFDLLCDWLSGEGEVIFSSSLNRACDARIISSIEFTPIDNHLCEAEIEFVCNPLKKQVPSESVISFGGSSNKEIYNPGTVPSKPLIMIEPEGTVTIAGQTMAFLTSDFSTSKSYAVGDCVVRNDNLYRFKVAHGAGAWDSSEVDLINNLWIDCENKIVIMHGPDPTVSFPYTGGFTGNFIEIPVGKSYANANGGYISMDPRWRWK